MASSLVQSLRFQVPWFEMEIKPTTVLLVSLGLLTFRQIVRLLKISRSVSYFPTIFTSFQPFALPGLLIPTTSWSTGFDWHWIRRFQTYSKNETVNLVPVAPFGGIPGLWTSNMEIGRQIASGGHRSSFIKPPGSNEAFSQWGMNLAASEGLMWRKHRRVVGPAFNTELYKLVWKKTMETYRDMVEVEGWKDAVDIPVIQTITLKFAFLLISSCGFGFPSTWDTPPQAADGGMPVQEALKIVADTTVLSQIVPKWLTYLPIQKLKDIRISRERLSGFMHEQVAERKAKVAAGDLSADAFTMLVKANQDESSKYQLDDAELIGNIFLFMFAGHETTAHSLAATFGYMAIHQDIQDEVVEQIISVVGPDRDPHFDDYSKLDKVLAIFYEAARMFPAGHVLIRMAAEDTVLTVPNPVGEEGSRTIPIPKGTEIICDMIGVQYNPRYFPDAHMYKPSRWYGLPTDSELFTAFSVGPRACIGRRFATVEATCLLALFLRDWKVLPILRDGETTEEWGARIMDGRIVITLGAADIPVRLVRRKPV
ncbi:cytochrome P450 [Mycena alexandri]|uniref:Cytochrome P450 n=1 Tax=Mycena alexandri TaxID=1745969 RepID=A0AAD6X3P8_9AGAR|nr:cytochrome P450 [Mycena alexandri]